MLKFLSISNIAVIPAARMELGEGFSVLSGETGAGKSILIDALGLVLGARAASDLIRTGAEQAAVEAVFELGEAKSWTEAHGLPAPEDGELVIRREINASGKGRASVNGAVVPVSVLRDLAPRLAVVHGQHAPQGLLDPATHLRILDHHAGLTADTETVAALFRQLRETDAALDALRRDRREAERRREVLAFQQGEIEKAALRPGESEGLRREKALLQNAERLSALSSQAYAVLYEDEGSALALLRQVWRKVEELAAVDERMKPHLDGRESVRAVLDDLALALRDYREAIAFPAGRLEEVDERLALLQRLQRKYGETEEQILAFAEDCGRELEALGGAAEQEDELQHARSDLVARYVQAARALSARRRSAAVGLEKKVEAELVLLAMERSRFRVRFTPDEPPSADTDPAGWTEEGLETGEFHLSPNPGEELRPLARIASGGELSRILLALNSVAIAEAPGKTLVFDEVDAGIGGRVAEVVGRQLRALASRHQVLCVTHLPQIASMADNHYAVRKRTERGRTLTEVDALDAGERVEEVARMLAGETVTEAARRHAREMVKQSLRS